MYCLNANRAQYDDKRRAISHIRARMELPSAIYSLPTKNPGKVLMNKSVRRPQTTISNVCVHLRRTLHYVHDILAFYVDSALGRL